MKIKGQTSTNYVIGHHKLHFKLMIYLIAVYVLFFIVNIKLQYTLFKRVLFHSETT